MTVGWLLERERKWDVVVVDKTGSVGLDAHALHIPPGDPMLKNARTVDVDLPIRMHTPSYYYNLIDLMRALEVETTDYYQDIALFDSKSNHIVSYSNQKIGSFTIPMVNGISWSSAWYCWQFLRFRWSAKRDLQSGSSHGKNLYDYLKQNNYSEDFIQNFLFTYLSMVCTCSYTALKVYPVEPILKFITSISSGRSLRHFKFGTKDLARRLEKPLNTKYGVGVNKLHLQKDGKVSVLFEDGTEELFDSVIIATEPTAAHSMIKDIPELSSIAEALSKFPVEKSSISVHTDLSLLPMGRNSPKNSMISRANTVEAHSLLQKSVEALSDVDIKLIQTWSTKCPAKPSTVYKEAIMSRAILTLESLDAVQVLKREQGKHNIWVVGAYVDGNIPLLEAGVSSAISIAERLGVALPWKKHVPQKHNSYSEKITVFILLIVIVAILVFFLY
uniref:Amine oxidase domain-containing protein n=1 Tax=Arcella intermedia TaxID=1963864 RepID=A0A6B2L3S0_9EUKA